MIFIDFTSTNLNYLPQVMANHAQHQYVFHVQPFEQEDQNLLWQIQESNHHCK